MISTLIHLIKYTLIGLLLFITFKMLPIHYEFDIRSFNQYTIKHKITMFTLNTLVDDNDKITFHINSYGGDVAACFEYINAVLNKPTHTIAHVHSVAHSAGAILMMAVDEIIVDKYSSVMFHKAQTLNNDGYIVVVDNILVDAFLKDYVFPYLTNKEKQLILNGQDVTLLGPDFVASVKMIRSL